MIMTCLLGTTGCWDSRELNDVVFIIGTGLDKVGKGAFSASVQLADSTVQAGEAGGEASGSTGYKVEMASGKDLSDALTNLQSKLPRHLITGHRQAIVIGEALARDGIGSYLDEFIRNPDNSLRTDLFIIKGDTAQDFLQNKYAFETFSALAAGKEQKLVSTYETSLRNLLFDAMNNATSGTLPVIDTGSDLNSMASNSRDQSKPSPAFAVNGTALFNRKLQLVGYLQHEQSLLYLWGVNRLQHITLSEPVDSSGNLISLQMSHLHSKIHIMPHKGHMVAQMTLSGIGRIVENHTKWRPSELRDIAVVQQRLDKTVSNKMQRLIIKTQEQYQADVFGFGEKIHQTYPSEWKHIKMNWQQEFPKIEIEVKTQLTILHEGELKTGDIFVG